MIRAYRLYTGPDGNSHIMRGSLNPARWMILATLRSSALGPRASPRTRASCSSPSGHDVIEHSGYWKDGFSMQTGSGAASTAATRFLEQRMSAQGTTASFALGGITGAIADLQKKGLVKAIVDVQSFDSDAAESLRDSPDNLEISANEYANPTSKAA